MIKIILSDDNTIEQTIEGETRIDALKALAHELAERNGEQRGVEAAVTNGSVRNSEATYPHDIFLADDPEAFWQVVAGHLLADSQDYRLDV